MTPITLLIYIHVLLLLSYTINTPLAYLLVCYVSSMRLAICLWRASPTPDAPRELHDLMAKVSDAGLGSAVFLNYFVVVIFLKRFNILDLAPSISADSCQLMAIIMCFLTAMVCESLMMIEVHWAMIVQCVLPTTVVSVFCLPRSSSHEERRRAWSMVPTGESLLMLPHHLLIFSHRLLVAFYFFNPPFAYLLVRFLFITWTAISTFSREESGTRRRRRLAVTLNGPDKIHDLKSLLYILKLVVWIYLSCQVLHIVFSGFNEHSGMLNVKILESAVLVTDLLESLVRCKATKCVR